MISSITEIFFMNNKKEKLFLGEINKKIITSVVINYKTKDGLDEKLEIKSKDQDLKLFFIPPFRQIVLYFSSKLYFDEVEGNTFDKKTIRLQLVESLPIPYHFVLPIQGIQEIEWK